MIENVLILVPVLALFTFTFLATLSWYFAEDQ